MEDRRFGAVITEVPEEVRKKLKVHFIRHISELLPLALRPK